MTNKNLEDTITTQFIMRNNTSVSYDLLGFLREFPGIITAKQEQLYLETSVI